MFKKALKGFIEGTLYGAGMYLAYRVAIVAVVIVGLCALALIFIDVKAGVGLTLAIFVGLFILCGWIILKVAGRLIGTIKRWLDDDK